jgi:hypothetical protein
MRMRYHVGLVVLMAVVAGAWPEVCLAGMPQPLVSQAQTSPLELVKKKKKADAEDEDDDPADRGYGDYMRLAFDFDHELHEEVEENMILQWLLGALLSLVGGHIWAPMIFYKEVPKNAQRKTALIFGALSLVAYGLIVVPGFVPFLFPGIYLFFLGGVAFIALAAFVTFLQAFMFPRMITIAYSDAYKVGGETGSKKKKRRKPVDEEDDE